MIFHEKAALEHRTRLRSIQIREQELALYVRNCRNLALVASLLAGIAYSALPYVTKMSSFKLTPVFPRSFFIMGLALLLGGSLEVSMAATAITMLSPGLALRGPTGSMDVAVGRLIAETHKLLKTFFILVHFLLLYLCVSLSFTNVSVGGMCTLAMTGTSLLLSFCIRRRRKKVEETFPMHKVPLHSGSFSSRGVSEAGPMVGRGVSEDARWRGHRGPYIRLI